MPEAICFKSVTGKMTVCVHVCRLSGEVETAGELSSCVTNTQKQNRQFSVGTRYLLVLGTEATDSILGLRERETFFVCGLNSHHHNHGSLGMGIVFGIF